ncbi:MAG: hypothetical protein J5517_06370 [Eubacterium sp.]|nr:hypothetical protein [Eubacterium sp.]
MESIIEEVNQIAYNIKQNPLLNESDCIDLPLTGNQLQFDPMDMCYLALEVISKYHIKLNASDIYDQRFNTIRSISETIANKQ